MRRDSRFCAKSVRYNIFTNGAPYRSLKRLTDDQVTSLQFNSKHITGLLSCVI